MTISADGKTRTATHNRHRSTGSRAQQHDRVRQTVAITNPRPRRSAICARSLISKSHTTRSQERHSSKATRGTCEPNEQTGADHKSMGFNRRPTTRITRTSSHLMLPSTTAWVEAVSALLPSEASDVLDVGTGHGFLAFIVASLGHRVTGIDPREGMLRCRPRLSRRFVRCGHEQALAVDIARAGNSVRELAAPGGRVDMSWRLTACGQDCRRVQKTGRAISNASTQSKFGRRSLPCTSTQWIRSSRCSGAPVLLAHQPGPRCRSSQSLRRRGRPPIHGR